MKRGQITRIFRKQTQKDWNMKECERIKQDFENPIKYLKWQDKW